MTRPSYKGIFWLSVSNPNTLPPFISQSDTGTFDLSSVSSWWFGNLACTRESAGKSGGHGRAAERSIPFSVSVFLDPANEGIQTTQSDFYRSECGVTWKHTTQWFTKIFMIMCTTKIWLKMNSSLSCVLFSRLFVTLHLIFLVGFLLLLFVCFWPHVWFGDQFPACRSENTEFSPLDCQVIPVLHIFKSSWLVSMLGRKCFRSQKHFCLHLEAYTIKH